MTIEKIIQSTDLLELLNALEDFCRKSYLREDDTECMQLIKYVLCEIFQ